MNGCPKGAPVRGGGGVVPPPPEPFPLPVEWVSDSLIMGLATLTGASEQAKRAEKPAQPKHSSGYCAFQFCPDASDYLIIGANLPRELNPLHCLELMTKLAELVVRL